MNFSTAFFVEQSMDRLADFLAGTEPCARQTEHYRYSEVFVEEYPATTLAVISSEEPVGFERMADFFTQSDPFEDWLNASGVERTGVPLTWHYHNTADQPLEPNGNPVRAPFLFEVGYEVRAVSEPLWTASQTAGAYLTRELRPLTVASVYYEGSFPHQLHSAFADAWMTLVTQAPVLRYELTGLLYREIYHALDYADPTKSVTEVQVEISVPQPE